MTCRKQFANINKLRSQSPHAKRKKCKNNGNHSGSLNDLCKKNCRCWRCRCPPSLLTCPQLVFFPSPRVLRGRRPAQQPSSYRGVAFGLTRPCRTGGRFPPAEPALSKQGLWKGPAPGHGKTREKRKRQQESRLFVRLLLNENKNIANAATK